MNASHPQSDLLIYIDELTGLYNRRYLKEKIDEISAAQSAQNHFSVAMLDIDNFKQINDTHGHLLGDQVLREFAAFIKEALRMNDLIFRYGGDEFLCIMPNTQPMNAEKIYHRLLAECKKRKFGGLQITISAGIASYPDDGETFDLLLKNADDSLYDAKRSGRDKIGVIRRKKIEIPTKIFVGRKHEMRKVQDLLSTKNKEVKVGLIVGNIGIGKTRLVKEVLGTCKGYEILWSDCLALEGIPYYPIRELVKYKIERRGERILKKMPLAYRIEIGKLIPELMEKIQKKSADITVVLDKYRLFESIKQLLAFGRKKKVIVIDNLQWADQESIEIIKYILRAVQKNTISFIFTYRTEEQTEILKQFVAEISRESDIREITLQPFNHAKLAKMIQLIITEKPDQELVAYIEQETGGNPFYIEELIKALNETQDLRIEADKWIFQKPDSELIPKSIEEITERKYKTLSNEAQEIIELMSVVGKFDVEILQQITGYNEGHLIGVAEKLTKVGLVKENQGNYEFQDEISRNALYKKNIIGLKRRLLHEKVAENIEKRHQGREQEVLEELAYHYYRAVNRKKGQQYCFAAAEKAKKQYANRHAVKYYTWTEELLKGENEVDRIELKIESLKRVAELYSILGQYHEAIENIDEALSAAGALDELRVKTDLLSSKLTVYLNFSKNHQLIEESSECLQLCIKIDDKRCLAIVLNLLGNAYYRLGNHEQALQYYEESLRVSEKLGNTHHTAIVQNNLGIVLKNSGKIEQALEKYEEVVAIVREQGDKRSEAKILNNMAMAYKSLGRFEQAFKKFEQAFQLAKIVGDIGNEVLVANNLGIIQLNLGNFVKSSDYLQLALKIVQDLGDEVQEAHVIHNLGLWDMMNGKYLLARDKFESSLLLFQTRGDAKFQGIALNSLGALETYLGEYKQAQQYLENSFEIFRSMDYNEGVSETLRNLGNVHYYQGEYRSAHIKFKSSLAITQAIQTTIDKFFVLLSIGKLYLAQDKLQQARQNIDLLDNIAHGTSSKIIQIESIMLWCQYSLQAQQTEKCEDQLKRFYKLLTKLNSPNFKGEFELLSGRFWLGIRDSSKAKPHFEQALSIFDSLKRRFELGSTYYYLGETNLLLNNLSAALNSLQKALQLFTAIGAQAWKMKVERLLKEL